MRRAAVVYDKSVHEARKYWRGRLDSIAFEARVPLDHPRPRNGEPVPDTFEEALDGETAALLRKVTGGSPFLVFAALLAGLEVCLARVCGVGAVTVLSPARTSDGGVPNLLPIGCRLDSESIFRDVLLAAKGELTAAFRHSRYPLPSLFLDLPEDGRPEALPLVAALAGFNDEIPELPGLSHDLALRFEFGGDRLTARLSFDRRLHEEANLRGFLQGFGALLHQGLEKMKAPLSQLPAALPSGGREGAVRAPASDLRMPAAGFLHRRIAERAAKDPQRAAVVEGGRVTRFGTLTEQAERLAKLLTGLGLPGDRPVAVLMDAGAEMVVALQAVLESGHAFASLKVLALEASLAGQLEAVGASCVLCRPEHLEELEGLRERLPDLDHVIALEDGPGGPDAPEPFFGATLAWSRRDGAPESRSGAAAGAQRPTATAAVLLDEHGGSLSLSRVSHGELAQAFEAVASRLGLGEEDRCLLSPSLAASDQLFGMLGVLAAGGSVVIPEAGSFRDPAALLEKLAEEEITVWTLPTGLALGFQRGLASPPDAPAAGLRSILLSGEKQSLGLAKELRRRFPGARLLGAYAPPALGVWSTVFPLAEPSPSGDAAVIAEAIPGFPHRLVNGLGEESLPSTPGELLVERTAAPPGEEARIATGLRGRSQGAGRLTWLRGPNHHFLKWGCRVELTRIEEILAEGESVVAAEVVAVGGEEGSEERVVAFVFPGDEAPAPEELRDFLVRHSGVDLIPDRIVVLEEVPLTAEGTIDQAVLEGRCLGSCEKNGEGASPEGSEIQQQLEEIWLESLQMEEVGEDSSFFKLGGNSLKATLLIARIRDRFGVDLSVQDFFREPSLRAVARLIEGELRNAEGRQERPGVKVLSRERYRVQMPNLES